jgi:hypothetical protein
VVEAAEARAACDRDRRKVRRCRERAHLTVDPTVVEVTIEVGGITEPRTIAAPTHTIGGVTIAATTHTTGRIRTTTRDSASGSDSDFPSGIHPSITAIHTRIRTLTLIRTRIHTRALDTHIQRDRRLIRRLTRPIRGPLRAATHDRV